MKESVERIIDLKKDNREEILLDLGCGNKKMNKDYIGIDAINYDAVDICGDVFEILSFFPRGSVKRIYASHFIEHIDDLEKLLSLIDRCLMKDGSVEFIAPHFSNPYFFSDPTHKTFFGLYTFCYFLESNLFRREVPKYEFNFSMELESVDLIFKSPKPFYLSYILKKILSLPFNLNYFFRETYEQWFSNILPCYEIIYKIKKNEI